ncbi:retrovirus-related pol polyprotein from transposon TNT 1-94 [Tanacetum coccineum]
MMLESIENGPLAYPTIEENGAIRPKKYAKFSKQENLQDECDVQALNIVLQGLPLDVYALVKHCQAAKEIWDRVKLLMQGTELSYQECECKLYNEFDKFTSIKGESLHEYYLRFSQLINDMHTIGITMQMTRYYSTSSRKTGSRFCWYENSGKCYKFRGNNAAGKERVVKCYNCQGEGHMARQCTQPKRPMNSTWFKEKLLLVQEQEAGKELDEEQLAFLADLGILDGQAIQTTIPQNAAFHTDDLDAYDSDCDDIYSINTVLMANLSSYNSNVLSEAPYSDTYQHEVINQSVPDMPYFKQTPIVDSPDNEITSYSNIIPYSQYLQES